jgi:hypothetical protein
MSNSRERNYRERAIFIITILGLVLAAFKGYTLLCERQNVMTSRITALEASGSLLARDNEKNIIRLMKDVTYIREQVDILVERNNRVYGSIKNEREYIE